MNGFYEVFIPQVLTAASFTKMTNFLIKADEFCC